MAQSVRTATASWSAAVVGRIQDDAVVPSGSVVPILKSPILRSQLGYDLHLDGYDTEHLSFEDRCFGATRSSGAPHEQYAIATLMVATGACTRRGKVRARTSAPGPHGGDRYPRSGQDRGHTQHHALALGRQGTPCGQIASLVDDQWIASDESPLLALPQLRARPRWSFSSPLSNTAALASTSAFFADGSAFSA